MLTYLCSFLWLTTIILGPLTYIEVFACDAKEYQRHRAAIQICVGSLFALFGLLGLTLAL